MFKKYYSNRICIIFFRLEGQKSTLVSRCLAPERRVHRLWIGHAGEDGLRRGRVGDAVERRPAAAAMVRAGASLLAQVRALKRRRDEIEFISFHIRSK